MEQAIQETAKRLREAKRVTVLTGAGVSKESGVPTFRDALEGLWSQYNPEDLATPQAFQRNPKLVWDWYAMRREMAGKVSPNAGHYALTELQKLKPDTVIVTQNVDDLHERAGNQDVIHLHGQIARVRCYDNCQGSPTIVDLATVDAMQTPPPCPHCGAYLRPDVVWFSESLPMDALARAYELCKISDVILVIGTSGIVSPASELPQVGLKHGATIIEINPQYSMITRIAHTHLEAPSGQVLPLLIEALHAE